MLEQEFWSSFFVSEKQEFRNKKANQSALNEVYKMKRDNNNNTKMSKIKVKGKS